ncbi:MAG: threonine--tRNA ligase [Acholeplasmatales bacterium]|jgi:threonyl-tRNA synthetase|nr:threonine--tRNA ligase [Acholeplasmatales bacterium]
MIKITLKDGSIKEYKENITPYEIALSINESLAKHVIGAYQDDELIEANREIKVSSKIELVKDTDPVAIEILRHSTAHVLAQAIKRLYPNALFGTGPNVEEGFYYDIFISEGFSAEDFLKVEKEMEKIAKEALPIVREEVTYKKAKELFKDDKFKLEILEDHKDSNLTIYRQNEFYDLCKGPHLVNTSLIKHFKLLNVAGAYFKSDAKNQMLQRIYGTAFFTKKDLDDYLKILLERKERDHRKIGKELDLFFTSKEVGQGLPFWLPKGSTVRRVIERYIVDKEISLGYLHVYTPILANVDLYKKSGHWDHYHDSMFPPMDLGDGEMLVLRPMNCPHHMEIYKNSIHSYKELPIRIAELGMMHRYEKSGALSGLQRVREMTLNDAHVFVRFDQIEEEFKRTLDLLTSVYEDFEIKDYSFRLSLRDKNNKEKYFDDDKLWEKAESELRKVLTNYGLSFFEAVGEAAFYGPKLDVQVKTATVMSETLSTIQLDFLLPERFDLTYVGEDGKNIYRPVVIHRGIVSTMERFVAYLIEEYKGAFPFWLAPVQLKVLLVNNEFHKAYGESVIELLKENGFRAELDDREEKLGYKIRESQTLKIPYSLIIGDNEVTSKTVNIRLYGNQNQYSLSLDDLLAEIKKLNKK